MDLWSSHERSTAAGKEAQREQREATNLAACGRHSVGKSMANSNSTQNLHTRVYN